MSTLRLRRKPFTEVVRNFDAFPKVPESVEENKKAFGGVGKTCDFIKNARNS